MNALYRLYCRTYQRIFRVALPVLPYRKPMILTRPEEMVEVMKNRGLTRGLLITDPMIRGLGITSDLEKAFADAGLKLSVFADTHPNPTTEDVENAYRLYRERGCQAIIGFGGGSSIDCAKGCGIRAARPLTPLHCMRGVMKVLRPLPPLFAVPTTSGSGSETTLACVLVDSKTRHKYVINDFSLIPRYAMLDPNCVRSLPPSVTAATGLDALTHAVEAYIGRTTTRDTRTDARNAVHLIFHYLPTCVADGENLYARSRMLRAAHDAGNAFTRSYVGYVHAVAHSLGGKYDTPHGLANAMLLPNVLEAYGPCIHRKLHLLANAAGIASENDNDSDAAAAFIRAIRQMQRDFGIPTTLAALKEEDIPELAKKAAKEANPLYPVPVIWDAKELEQLYYSILEK